MSLGDTLEDDNCQGELEPIKREPAAIDMIYAKGVWQNEHGWHRFWNDVQSIADYNF